MRVADYIAQLVADGGISQGFVLTGGGAMHLNDAFGREKRLNLMFCHHEQACAMAAESYARLTGNPALVNVTTGPGGINALNGVFGAYTDSIPMVVISGQVRRETISSLVDLPLRQLGDQEVDIVAMVSKICKSAVLITDIDRVRYEVEKAIWLCTAGRPGPVWIDVPMDIQGSNIDPTNQAPFQPISEYASALPHSEVTKDIEVLSVLTQRVLTQLSQAKRPVILAGGGIRASKSYPQFLKVIEKLGIPVTTGWNAHDLIWNDHELYAGRPGSFGDRAGNFTVQNADYLLILGSRLNIRQISYNFSEFSPRSYKVMVDVDLAEIEKPTLSIDLPLHCDLKVFLKLVLDSEYEKNPQHAEYLNWCQERVHKYPVVLPEYFERGESINHYSLIDSIFQKLKEGQKVVTADGAACVATFHAAFIKKNQRLYTNSGSASMGYDLPAAIGASIGSPGEEIVCLAGDGSIMMNLQELQTISHHKMPIKIFLLNNNGYSSIKQTQNNYFPDNSVGCDPASGVTFPEFQKIASSFEVPSKRCSLLSNLATDIEHCLSQKGPFLLEVILDPEQIFSPKLSSRRLEDGSIVSATLEDMSPFLSEVELTSNMLSDG